MLGYASVQSNIGGPSFGETEVSDVSSAHKIDEAMRHAEHLVEQVHQTAARLCGSYPVATTRSSKETDKPDGRVNELAYQAARLSENIHGALQMLDRLNRHFE